MRKFKINWSFLEITTALISWVFFTFIDRNYACSLLTLSLISGYYSKHQKKN